MDTRNDRKQRKRAPVHKVEMGMVRSVMQGVVRKSHQLKWVGSNTSYTQTNAGSYQDVTVIAQGTTALTRVGSSVDAVHFHFHLQWLIGDTTQVVRTVVFIWHPDNTSDAPQDSEIWDGGATYSPFASPVLYKPRRFTMLYDKSHTMDTYHPTILEKIEMKLNVRATFNIGVSTGINHVYFGTYSDSTGVPNPSVTGYYQLAYKDTE